MTWMFFAPSKSRYRAKIWCLGVPKTSDHILINIRIPNPSQESPVSSNDPNEDLKGHGCSWHLQNQDREPKFGIHLYDRPVIIFKSRLRSQTPVRNHHPHQNPKSGLRGHGCSWHLQNQDREPNFGI